MSRRALRSLLVVSIFLFLNSPLRAQITEVNNATSTPVAGVGHDYIHLLGETVNPANGSVSLRIKVPVPPGRGLTLPFAIAYDSNGAFTAQGTGNGPVGMVPTGDFLNWDGWSYTVPVQSNMVFGVNYSNNKPTCYLSTGYVFRDSNASRYSFNKLVGFLFVPNQCVGYVDKTLDPVSVDFYSASIAESQNGACGQAVTISDLKNTTYYFPTQGCVSGTEPTSVLPSKVEDRNGNIETFTATNSSGTAFTINDTLGRTVISSSGFGATGNTITVSGFAQLYTLTWGTTTTNFLPGATFDSGAQGCASSFSSTGFTNPVVTAITLPNGQQFQFSYDPTYGLLSKITYPTGGYTSYTWGYNTRSDFAALEGPNSTAQTCLYTYDSVALQHRYVSYDGVNIAEQQDFSYTTTWNPTDYTSWTAKQTIVTTHDLVNGTSFQTSYAYGPFTPNPASSPFIANHVAPQLPLEQTIVYKGTSGNILRTVSKTWWDQYELKNEQTILDNGQTSQVNLTWGGGLITEKDEYDFGQSTLTRKTTHVYGCFDQPTQTVVYDGSGNRLAETDAVCDGASTSAVSNLPSGTHDETNYGPSSTTGRGNVTSLTKQCFQGSQGCTNSVTTYTYDETGQALTMTDACGNATCSDMTGTNHSTTYSYTDSYSSCSGTAPPSGSTNAYLTKVTNALGQSHSFCYGYTDGQLRGSTDANGLTTIYKYADSLARLTETDLADGGQTLLSYNDTPPSPTVTASKKINGAGLTFTTVAVSDGVGHIKQSQLTSDPQGTVYTDTTYDGLGRVRTVSNPYRSGSDPTTSLGTTTYTYDSLGRKLSEAYPDNSVLQTAYCGPSTLVTDPTGKWRRSRTDAFGRLVEVDEPNAVGATVNSNGCPATGDPVWVTSYTVDPLGNLTNVIQNGSRQRAFSYDSLSHLLNSNNPEVGITSYTYDANNNVASKTTPLPNQDGASGTGSATVSGSEQSVSGAAATSGTGSVTFSGTLQSKQVQTQTAAAGTGSVTFSGTLQSKQVQTQVPTSGTGTVTIEGGEQWVSGGATKIYDTGSVSITVNGFTATATYGKTSTTTSIASALQTTLNGSSSPVTTTLSGSTLTLTAKATGTSSNYSLSSTSQTNDPNDFGSPSFTGATSGSTLTGGGTKTVTNTIYDSGTSTITVNGHADSVSWSGSGTTTSSIASSLASAINGDSGASVAASASGATVSLTAKTTGSNTNYSLSSSYTYDSTDFSSGSFTSSNSGSTLTGGKDNLYTTVYDSGTSTVTVNGHADAISWSGSGTTTSSIASSLASAINGDSGASVTASVSGATVNLTAKTSGANTNYSLSSSYTYDSTDFSSSSFTSSNSGSALTGGHNAGPPTYDAGSVWITINGTQTSVSYGQNSTSASLANSLASAINANTSLQVTASVSGSTVNLVANTIGSSTNYSLSTGSSSSQSFSPVSFSVSASGSSMTGGGNPGSFTVTTSYSYDVLDRNIGRTYSNGDPTVTITYDQSSCLGLAACQNIGYRTSETDVAGSEAWSYQVDPTNHRSMRANQRTTNGHTKTSTYYLDLSGNVTQAVYPTGRVVNYGYDAADRPSNASDGSNGITYASDFESAPTGCLSGKVCYTPQGTFYALSIGQTSSFTGLNLTHTYNSRLQPNEFKASSSGGNAIDITYGFVDPVTSHNSGHVYSITNNLDSTRSQTFTYDQLNRITGAQTNSTYSTSPAHCWGENYSIDAWGNLQSISATTNSSYTGCTVESGFSMVADGNNHLTSFFSHDAAGNVMQDGTFAYTWDAEGELKSAGGVNYTYDGDGRRVSKSNGKLYWYGSGGDILAETDTSGNTTAEYIFFGGKRVAMLPASSTPIYYVEDMLGTSRVTTTNTGTVCYDADFYPYGGERTYTNSCSQNYKFEGKERDTETGNDEFGARYYSNRFGRWLSADWSNVPVAVPYANLTNPQTLNLYAMVADDPESFADLDGHDGETLIISLLEWGAGAIGITITAPEALAGAGAVAGLALAGSGREPATYVPGGLTDGKGNSVFSSQYRNSLKQDTNASSTNTQGTQPAQTGQSTPAQPSGNNGSSGGDRAGKPFTPKGKDEVKSANAANNGGQTTCQNCGQSTVPAQQSQSGVTPPGNETHVDHIVPKSQNGDGSPSNGQVLCRTCNLQKSDKIPPQQ
jgi:RHS repeat-associated protein